MSKSSHFYFWSQPEYCISTTLNFNSFKDGTGLKCILYHFISRKENWLLLFISWADAVLYWSSPERTAVLQVVLTYESTVELWTCWCCVSAINNYSLTYPQQCCFDISEVSGGDFRKEWFVSIPYNESLSVCKYDCSLYCFIWLFDAFRIAMTYMKKRMKKKIKLTFTFHKLITLEVVTCFCEKWKKCYKFHFISGNLYIE